MTALDRFAPVSLDDLVSEAALLTRIDRKYVLTRAELGALLDDMDAATRVLDIGGARDFAYESVYFDTPDLLSFRMAAQPRRRRFKLRTRSYLDTGSAFLELKTRGVRGTTVKEREECDPAQTAVLTARARRDIAEVFDDLGVAPERAGELEPALVTRYRRATLLAPDGIGRATVDTGLAWLDARGGGFSLPGVAIVETKSGSAPSVVDRTLWRHGIRPATVSKYATGMAALHPELPHNRWARLLRGPFSPDNRLEEASCPAAA